MKRNYPILKKENITTYEQAVEYLLKIPKFTSKNTLEDTALFLGKLGNPDRKLRIIHVAGTNGKGSVCAYLRSILESSGKSVCLFTSPHLVDIRERFYIKGKQINRNDFLRIFLEIYDKLNWNELEVGEGYHPTFFEYLFLMSMVSFAEHMPDYCILETGLGGRLDATNAVAEKILTIITRISQDHVEYLGHSIESIAGEKAGILKVGVPVLYLDEVDEASHIIQKNASLLQIPTEVVSKNDYLILKFNNKSIDFSYQSRYYGYIELILPTIARYQVENATLAIKAFEIIQEVEERNNIEERNDLKKRNNLKERNDLKESNEIKETNELKEEQISYIKKGISTSFWAGRMEEVLPDVFVDGAHNDDGIRAFIETVKEDGKEGKRTLLFGVVADKDYIKMMTKLLESNLFHMVYGVHLRTNRSLSLIGMEDVLKIYPQVAYKLFENVTDAFEEMQKSTQEDERIYVVGSLYLVGEIKEYVNELSHN